MKKERKESLLSMFPAVPANIEEMMKGRGAENFVVFLIRQENGELFARCFHRYANGYLAERQRYVFAKDGAVRYGRDDGKSWEIRTEFREPVFCQSNYGYTFNNSYCILNYDAKKHSCMKYACVSTLTTSLYMEYLKLYCMHPNVEYLMKTGYGFLINEEYDGYWGTRLTLSVSPYINWKSNNLLKMLGLNKAEFKALQGKEKTYIKYRMWKDRFPAYSMDKLLILADAFGYEFGTAERIAETTGMKLLRIARYISESKLNLRDYCDYTEQCIKLKYDLHDTAIAFPNDFPEIHTRLSNIIKYDDAEGLKEVFRRNMEQRKALEFSGENLFIRQPDSYEEIVEEGSALHHCVGGYAERHALGKLNIMFIRSRDEPEKPFYTMEVSTAGKIVQVRGERNCPPTKEVAELVENYKKYLKSNRKERKTA